MSIELKAISPKRKLKRTISKEDDIDELVNELREFIVQSKEAVAAGEKMAITCQSFCCLSIKNCLKFKKKS